MEEISSDLASRGPVPVPTQTVVILLNDNTEEERTLLRNGETQSQKSKQSLSTVKSFNG